MKNKRFWQPLVFAVWGLSFDLAAIAQEWRADVGGTVMSLAVTYSEPSSSPSVVYICPYR